MSRSELASMIESLGEYQVEELCRMAEGFLSLNEELNDTTPKVCPRCKSETARFIKKGFSGRKQRYQCQDCKSKFTYDAGKITACSHQSEEKWAMFIEDTISLKTLDECAQHIDVCHTTSFFMRQKLLAFFEEATAQDSLLDGWLKRMKLICMNPRKASL